MKIRYIVITSIVLVVIISSLMCIKFVGYDTDTLIENDLNKNNSNEIDIYSYNLPIVPDGFVKIETENASWELDENGIPKGWNQGLVIEDADGNQFVWIPVTDITKFERKEGYYQGQQQKYLVNCGEANYTNSTIESKEMYESISKYKGFYIARYEAGLQDISKKEIWDGTIKPLSKKGLNVWNYIQWGSAYGYALDGIQGSDLEDGAVKVARSMYPNIKYLKEFALPDDLQNDTGVISTLCYGIQWDMIMEFLSDINNEAQNTKFIENSTDMGWFSFNSHNELQLTGTDIDDNSSNCTKNIYDLAGNVYEWTMEYYKNNYRIYRGGMYEMGNVLPSASMRAHAIPDIFDGSSYVGFRVALYLK